MSSTTYRFVGSYARVYDTNIEITKFGQLVSIPDEHAPAIAGLLPPEEFDAIGFTADDLDPYKAKDASFETKVREAHAAAIRHRAVLLATKGDQ